MGLRQVTRLRCTADVLFRVPRFPWRARNSGGCPPCPDLGRLTYRLRTTLKIPPPSANGVIAPLRWKPGDGWNHAADINAMNLTGQSRAPRIFKEPQMSFLIFASPKSGTTWIQRLLSQHPEVVCTESRAFGNYYDPNPLSTPHLTLEKYFSILSHYFAPSVHGLKPADDSFYRAALFNCVDALAATTMATLNKRFYGEKVTPYATTAQHAVALLQEYNPGIKFVNLTRDGRDVIVSGGAQWLNHRLRRASTGEKAMFQNALRSHTIIPEDFDRFLGYWTEAVTVGLRARDRFPCYLPLSYETLLADPISQATILFDFLGIDANPAVVRSCVEATAFDKLSGGRKPGEEDSHSFFRKGEAGDWKNWFSQEQERMFEQRAGNLLRELGYA